VFNKNEEIEEKIKILNGKKQREKMNSEVEDSNVIVITPSILLNLLRKGEIKLSQT
jgi:ERCC4-related helicase